MVVDYLKFALLVPGGGEGEVDGWEEQVRHGQGDHEGGGGVRPELLTPEQRHHSQQIAWDRVIST